jgi:peptidoglycan/LPS O-acetylase OafA/YrhL
MFGFQGFPQWTNLLKPPVLFNSMADWAIYFPLGLIMSMHNAALKPLLFRYRWLIAAAAVLVFVVGILDAFQVLSAPWARFLAPLPVMFLLPIVHRGSIPLVKQVEVLGKRSYGIYLAHFVVINVVVFLVRQLHPGLITVPIVTFPAFLIVALGLSLLLMEGMTMAPPARRVYRYVFG